MNDPAYNQTLFDSVGGGNSNFDSNVTYTANDTLVHTSTTVMIENVPNGNMLITGFMMGLVAVFSSLLCYILLPIFLQWLRRKIPVTTAQINRRYETIEGWLITKRVKAHCTVCEEMQRRFVSQHESPSINLLASHDSAETILHEQEQHQCPICMEPFEHNDLVSWSPSKECEHVFHHSCIKTWLLHHECCPYCRISFLSVDNRSIEIAPTSTRASVPSLMFPRKRPKRVQTWGKDQLKELAMQRHQRLISTYYCLKEGLVSLDQPLTVHPSEIDTTNELTINLKTVQKSSGLSLSTMKTFFVSDVQPNEMIALRTHPKSIHATSDVVVTITSPVSYNADDAVDTPIVDNTTIREQDDDDLKSADEIVDVEMTMKELPVISNDVTYQDDSV